MLRKVAHKIGLLYILKGMVLLPSYVSKNVSFPIFGGIIGFVSTRYLIINILKFEPKTESEALVGFSVLVSGMVIGAYIGSVLTLFF